MHDIHSIQPLLVAINCLKHKIIQKGDSPYISVEKQLDYIDELSRFPLGRVLLEKGSIDTFWTDFIINRTESEEYFSDFKLEEFILNRSPFVLAWKELFQTFRKIIQESLEDNMILASIPCGAMRELLELDYSSTSNYTLIGVDIDNDSLSLASQFAEKTGLSRKVKLCQEDAWQLPYDSEIDLITSCGLNIYISDQAKVLALYRQFWKALRPGGKLIIGFLTYPPDEQMDSEWRIDKISPEDLVLEKVLYKDILDLHWRNFRTSNEFKRELEEAGFSNVTFHYDTLHVFPTVVAKK